MNLVYLAGPITGLAFAGATDWRDYAKGYLNGAGIAVLSPMRYKTYLDGEATILDSYEHHPLSSARGLTARDRFDTQRSDLVLMNLLGATRVSIGSMIELGWADSKRIPIVAVMEEENLHRHAMVRECVPYIIPTLDEALALVAQILLP